MGAGLHICVVGPLRILGACILEGLAGASPYGVFLSRPARRLIRNEPVTSHVKGEHGLLGVSGAALAHLSSCYLSHLLVTLRGFISPIRP